MLYTLCPSSHWTQLCKDLYPRISVAESFSGTETNAILISFSPSTFRRTEELQVSGRPSLRALRQLTGIRTDNLISASGTLPVSWKNVTSITRSSTDEFLSLQVQLHLHVTCSCDWPMRMRSPKGWSKRSLDALDWEKTTLSSSSSSGPPWLLIRERLWLMNNIFCKWKGILFYPDVGQE